jgi:ketol-acid reductoisomerase
MHELKIIVDLFTRHGFSGMRERISRTAAYGSLKHGESLLPEEMGRRMGALFDLINTGAFARSWLDETRRGRGSLDTMLEAERALAIEEVGKRIRAMFERPDES